ncbi:hypothetical protein [Bartonella doshiae]|uniref:Uncharacterized protein n=2 Tax=Bartonella doshiae TaxID=33044 RepID=A0A380ZEM3_BARDO|nr:hypothetical protein [Bartonella doshiae]EJF79009.1 hypothetical protein MCS_01555 [Bartonella doshiae NCTC 12862 = ATCC 700133]MBB6159909.1 hypothetical protein [Bartonella doshiae]SUV45413.1 Uncharacterised protein [Bartonella doshiae]
MHSAIEELNYRDQKNFIYSKTSLASNLKNMDSGIRIEKNPYYDQVHKEGVSEIRKSINRYHGIIGRYETPDHKEELRKVINSVSVYVHAMDNNTIIIYNMWLPKKYPPWSIRTKPIDSNKQLFKRI